MNYIPQDIITARTKWPAYWPLPDVDLQKTMLWNVNHESYSDLDQLSKIKPWLESETIILVDCQPGCLYDDVFLNDNRVHLFNPVISDLNRQHSWMFWYEYCTRVEKDMKLYHRCLPPSLKNPRYMFDSLLGASRDNKNFVRRKVSEKNLNNKFILGANTTVPVEDGEGLPVDWVPGGNFDIGVNTVRHGEGPGNVANVSCFLPYSIYNNSFYSLVCETVPDNWPYLTEKTARPLLAKRIFVIFGAKGYVQALQNLGFETFGDIIDESYDSIDDPEIRWNKAWEQIEFLSNQNPVALYKKVSDILDYNYNTMMNNTWMQDVVTKIEEICA